MPYFLPPSLPFAARGKQTPSVSSLKRLNRPEYIRAVGPKESPRNRSLVFVHPSQYRPSRKGTRGVYVWTVRAVLHVCFIYICAYILCVHVCLSLSPSFPLSLFFPFPVPLHPSLPSHSLPFLLVHPTSAQSSAKSVSESSLCIHSVEWSRPLSPRKKGTKSPSDTAQYHSLVGDVNLGQHTRKSPRKKTKTHPPVKVLPMKILDSPQHPQVVTT